MTDGASWTGGRVAALLAAALIAGALMAGWRARPRTAAMPAAREELAFAVPLLKQRAAPLTTRLAERFAKQARPLPDALFADAGEPGTAAFADIAGPLTAPGVQFRALGRPEGSFLRTRTTGWHAFAGQRWVQVKREAVPESVRRHWPDPDPQAMRRDAPSRDGDMEVP